MDRDERRIRTLKLSGCEDMPLRKVRYRLEEAFRTASLPGVPPNAQLLVRRLNLGKIPVDLSSVLLASRISELVRNLTAAASCVDYQPAAHADVVWFSDLLQAYKVVLLRLLDGTVLHEWYWRTLFPNLTLVLNSATIEMILSQAATTPLKGLAVARLLQETLEPRRLERLFSCITQGLVRRLMHEQGVSLATVADLAPRTAGRHLGPMQAVRPPNMSLPWRYAILQAAHSWGDRDVRTLWFAWYGLILHRPAWLERKEVVQRIVPGIWLESWGLPQNSIASREKTAAGVDTVIDTVTDGLMTGLVEDEGPATSQSPAASPPPEPGEVVAPVPGILPEEAGSSVSSSSWQFPGDKVRAPASSCPAEVQQQKIDADMVETTLRERGIKEPGGDIAPVGDVAPRVLVPWSAHAGLAFFIPLLQRLGMAELLEGNERLLELDLPRELLWSLAQRFDIAESDPFMPLFEGFAPSGDVSISRFCCPAGWRTLVTASGRPLKALDITGRMETIQFSELLKTIQLLAGLYLRRCCSLSLRSLIKRSGRVVMTATHWDVIFNINQIDLRLRRVALDCDPGWVVWLGRVVQFHYDSEGEPYVS